MRRGVDREQQRSRRLTSTFVSIAVPKRDYVFEGREVCGCDTAESTPEDTRSSDEMT